LAATITPISAYILTLTIASVSSWSPEEFSGSIFRLTNKLDIRAYYDSIVGNVEPANLPYFFENFSTMLVETDESVCALAAEHQARLDQLTEVDYERMDIEQGILMSRVQYQLIGDLQKRDL